MLDATMLPLSRYMMLHATSPSGHFTLFIFSFFRLKMGHKEYARSWGIQVGSQTFAMLPPIRPPVTRSAIVMSHMRRHADDLDISYCIGAMIELVR